MLAGIALYVVVLILAGRNALRALAKHRIRVEPSLTRTDDLATAGEDLLSRRLEELARLGCESEGTWRYEGNDPAAANQKQQTLVVGFLAPGKTSEVFVGVTRVLAARNVSRSVGILSVRSFGEDGRVWLTTTSGKRTGFPRSPRHHVLRTSARTVKDLLEAHAGHLVSESARPMALDAAAFSARELGVSRTTHEHWLERGVVVRDGEWYRYTRGFALRSYLRRALWPPLHANRLGPASLAYASLLAASGAGAYGLTVLPTDRETAGILACALFATIAVASNVVVRAPLAWGLSCVPAAIVLANGGFWAPWPWITALGAMMLFQPALRSRRFAKDHAAFEAAEGKRVEPPQPQPPADP